MTVRRRRVPGFGPAKRPGSAKASAAAFAFELGKVFEQTVKERMLGVLAQVNADLCAEVAAGLGLPAPSGSAPTDVVASPALSQILAAPGPITGRVIGVVVGPNADLAGVGKLRTALAAEGAVLRVIAATGGILSEGSRQETVERTFLTTRSIEYDAVVLAAGTADLADLKLSILLQEAFRHAKVIAAWGDGTAALETAGIDTTAPGVLLSDTYSAAFTKSLVDAIGLHRVWDRVPLVIRSV